MPGNDKEQLKKENKDGYGEIVRKGKSKNNRAADY